MRPYECYECGSLFCIDAEIETGPISFCPYCSSELSDMDDELDDEDTRH